MACSQVECRVAHKLVIPTVDVAAYILIELEDGLVYNGSSGIALNHCDSVCCLSPLTQSRPRDIISASHDMADRWRGIADLTQDCTRSCSTYDLYRRTVRSTASTEMCQVLIGA